MDKLWITLLGIAVTLFVLSGCALFDEQINESADAIGEGVLAYCENMPGSERPAFKAKVEEACNCKIELTCP